MSKPPSKLPRRLKVAAPRHMAKKKSFRSAPRMVRGRESERCTELILRVCVTAVSPGSQQTAAKEPRHEVDGSDRHANAEEDPGEDTLRAAFTEGESQPGYNNGDEGQSAGDGAGESLLQDVDGVLPGGVRLGKRGSRERKSYKRRYET